MTPPRGPQPEAGCNCEHLADDATCIHCAITTRPGDNPSLITDGGQPTTFDAPEHKLDDETVVEDIVLSCELAAERGTTPTQILAALDGVASVVNEEAEIPEWLIIKQRTGVDIRDAGAETVDELVAKARDDHAWYDPRGWF